MPFFKDRHPGESRDPCCRYFFAGGKNRIKMDPGFRRDDESS